MSRRVFGIKTLSLSFAADHLKSAVHEYRAAMVKGQPHPDDIVETASLASVKPPKPTYQHHLQVRQ